MNADWVGLCFKKVVYLRWFSFAVLTQQLTMDIRIPLNYEPHGEL